MLICSETHLNVAQAKKIWRLKALRGASCNMYSNPNRATIPDYSPSRESRSTAEAILIKGNFLTENEGNERAIAVIVGLMKLTLGGDVAPREESKIRGERTQTSEQPALPKQEAGGESPPLIAGGARHERQRVPYVGTYKNSIFIYLFVY